MEEKNIRRKGRSRKQKLSDQMFMKSMRRMLVGNLLLVCCLISTTWAWFIASADSQVFEIQLQEIDMSIVAKNRAMIHKNQRGEYRMQAGSYTIEAKPFTGAAAMYCLVHIRNDNTVSELAKQAVDEFNESEEQEYLPVLATNSNSIRVLKSDLELETLLEEYEEEDSFIYEVLPFSVMIEGTYRVDWEPEEERRFVLNLEKDAIVSFDIFWLTEDAEEYPALEEMMEYNYVVIYQVNKASPSNLKKMKVASKKKTSAETKEAVSSLSSSVVSTEVCTENTSQETTEEVFSETETKDFAQTIDEAAAETKETLREAEDSSAVQEDQQETERDSTMEETNAKKEIDIETEASSEIETVQKETESETKEENSMAEEPQIEEIEITPEMSTEDIESAEI